MTSGVLRFSDFEDQYDTQRDVPTGWRNSRG